MRRTGIRSRFYMPGDAVRLGEFGSSTFNPHDIAGLRDWDFSDVSSLFQDSAKTTPVTADGQVIGAANDLSSNGDDVLQPTAARKPLYKVNIKNGLSVAQFDGSDDWLRATFTLNQPCTYYLVVSQIAWTLNRRVMDGAVNQAMIFQSSTTPKMRAQAGLGATDEITLATGTFGIVTAFLDGVNSTIRLNDGAPSATANIGANNPGGVTLGGRAASTTNTSNVNIGRAFTIPAAVSAEDDADLLALLNSQWAIF